MTRMWYETEISDLIFLHRNKEKKYYAVDVYCKDVKNITNEARKKFSTKFQPTDKHFLIEMWERM